MPEEVLILFVITLMSAFVLTFTSMILRHRRKRRQSSAVSEGQSMTTSDLERLMRQAVEDATLPLVTKVEDLELEMAKLASKGKQLEAHDTSTRLELEDEVLDVEPMMARSKTRP